jgi:hypothetical protein
MTALRGPRRDRRERDQPEAAVASRQRKRLDTDASRETRTEMSANWAAFSPKNSLISLLSFFNETRAIIHQQLINLLSRSMGRPQRGQGGNRA